MHKNILEVKRLSHRYSRSWAIRDINFDIHRAGVTGLLGSNGAGKSTTMNIMCGVLRQTEGSVLINGIDLREEPEKAKQLIGFLPQQAPLHLDLTVDEYLHYCAQLRNVSASQAPAAIAEAKEKCGVSHFSRRLLRNLSGGYRQRVGIAQAILHRPLLVVLDEPTNGLDPNQITEVRKLIKDIGQERAVILSSHILSEVQATCRDIKMIEGGQVVFSDSMQAFNNYVTPHSLLVRMEAPPPYEELSALPGVRKVEEIQQGYMRMFFDTDAQHVSRIVVTASVEKGWHLHEIMLERSTLDEVFARLSRKDHY